jgi:hypothetical protein
MANTRTEWGLRPFLQREKYRLFEVKQFKDTPTSTGVSWCLTQAFLTANSCINVSGFGSQTLIARVEHAAWQIVCYRVPESARGWRSLRW